MSGGASNLLTSVGKQVYYVAVLCVAVVINTVVVGISLALDMGLEGVAGGAAISYCIFAVLVNVVAWDVVRSA